MRTAVLPLAALALASSAQALSSCAIFDTAWNLYLLGGSSDVNLGGADSWSSPSATNLTSDGRPPYTGANLTCHLSQYNNAFYLLGADAANPGDVYIFNAASSSWSTQSTTDAPSFESAGTILDHDTNVFFSLEGSTLSQLDLSSVTNAAAGGSLAWSDVGASAIDSSDYVPTMAIASNHIMFMGVPDVAAGSADIFVVHYSAWQATSQAFPTLDSGATFPTSHGQATSFWLDSADAQLQFAFVPDDFSGTFVVTHWTNPSTAGSTDGAPDGISSFINATQALPAPSSQDVSSSYAASDVGLVQLTSTGEVFYLPAFSAAGGYAVDGSATWAKIDYTLPGATGGSSSSSSSSSAAAGASASAGASSASSTPTGASASAAAAASSSAAAAGGTSGAGVAVDFSGVGRLALTACVGLGAFFLL